MTVMPAGATDRTEESALADQASGAVLAANPFVRIPLGQLLGAAARTVARVATDRDRRRDRVDHLRRAMEAVVSGRSDVEPDPKDRRFSDVTWAENAIYRRLMQAYLVVERELKELPAAAGLDPSDARRAAYVAALVAETLAPTNMLLGNPAALKRAFETGGASLAAGLRNFAADMRGNGGMPRMVDTSAFEVGTNIAATPGAVVHQTDVLELIQYRPTTATVHARPLLIVPPQINRYYVLDLAPGRSLVEHLVRAGHQVFMISWRNPTAAHRDWDLERYVREARGALEAGLAISGADRMNVLGACAGGVTAAVLLGTLACRGDDRIGSATFLVTVLDYRADSAATLFADEASIAAAARRSRRRGILDGAELSRAFSWLRPNDLVWNYWVHNYLLGEDPPAFDVLAWNVDNTNLPAGLHVDFLDAFSANALATPGALIIDGAAVDLRRIQVDSFVIGAATDHITPWKACYRTLGLLGGRTDFILSSSGHIQCLVNPPGNPRSSFLTNDARHSSPDAWLETAQTHEGSWWEHWTAWLDRRSGDQRRAPTALGNKAFPTRCAAPGRYVRS